MFFIRWAILVFFLLASLATWVPKIRVAGVAPDLLLGVVFVFAVRRGAAWGTWAGFILGLLISIESPAAIGVDSLALALAALLVARASAALDRTNPLVLVVLLFLASLSAETVRVLWLGGGHPGETAVLWFRWALPGALYTTILLPLLAWGAARVLGRRDWFARAA